MVDSVDNQSPIGVFDSGLGGIVVLRELMNALPNENFVYLGDTQNMPYGEKDVATLVQLGRKNIDFLKSKGCKLICAACGTISSLLKNVVKNDEKIPIIGIIDPVCSAITNLKKTSKIGIIATNCSVNTDAYLGAIKSYDESIEVFQKGCPKLVQIIENGSIFDKDLLRSTLVEYLGDFLEFGVEILVLGCTHFPIIKNQVREFFNENGREIQLIDPGIALAEYLKPALKRQGCENVSGNVGRCEFFVSKKTKNFVNMVCKILGKPINIEVCKI